MGGLFAAQREMILIATRSQKPPITSDVFNQLLKPTQAELSKVNALRENNRSSPYSNHLATVADGVPALGWIALVRTIQNRKPNGLYKKCFMMSCVEPQDVLAKGDLNIIGSYLIYFLTVPFVKS